MVEENFLNQICEGLGEVRTALLEADVAYDVVEEFLDRVSADAVGAKVLDALDPAQQLIGIVHRELINLMGPVDHELSFHSGDTTILMLCGLQGSGKTTTCGKLARRLKEQGKGVMLVAADLQRPAAIEQLSVLGEQIGIPVHTPMTRLTPLRFDKAGVKKQRRMGSMLSFLIQQAGFLLIKN